jgi:UDP-glucose 4-epimerase
MKKNILVTGGAGYIGSHACKYLKQAGYTPITLDNLSTGWKDAVKYGPFEKVDLLDKKKIDSVFQKYSPIATIHFAGLSQVGESVIKPALYWENNVLGSLNLIQSAVENNCMKFIFSSTCAVFGEQNNIILNEMSYQNPLNSYAASKRAIENILDNFDTTYNLKYITLRYFNVAGADPECEIGEFHQPETHLIPLILESISDTKNPFTIFGTDYDTSDGTCIRDYVHVCDLIDAHILGFEWLEKNNMSRSFNLGTGKGFSVFEVIDETERITNKSLSVIHGSRRKGDCAKLVSGSNRAIQELGWSLNRSNLRTIIQDAWNWKQKGFFKE